MGRDTCAGLQPREDGNYPGLGIMHQLLHFIVGSRLDPGQGNDIDET